MPGETILSILQRLIDFSQGRLPRQVAEAVLQIQFADADQARIAELGRKSTTGKLTSDEAMEYDAFIAAADLLSLWKSKARLSLKQHSSAA